MVILPPNLRTRELFAYSQFNSRGWSPRSTYSMPSGPMVVTWVTYSPDFAQRKWDVSPGRTLEDCVETFLLDAVKANGFVKPSFRIDILFESDRKAGAEFRLVTLGVERGTTAFRGCERNPASLKTK